MTAYSAEALLLYRPMPFVTATGKAGHIYQQMLGYANAIRGFQINAGTIFEGGVTATVNMTLSALEEAKNLAAATAQDFDVTALIGNSTRMLDLAANWYSQKGVVVGSALTEGAGGNMKLPVLTEQGTIVNLVDGYDSSSSTTTRISSSASDDNSQADYGILGQNQVFNVTGQDGVDQATKNYRNNNRRPQITLELTALDVGNTFSGLVTGNVWNVQLMSVGFTGANIGFNSAVRLMGIEYDDWTNEAKLITQVLTGDLSEDNYA